MKLKTPEKYPKLMFQCKKKLKSSVLPSLFNKWIARGYGQLAGLTN